MIGCGHNQANFDQQSRAYTAIRACDLKFSDYIYLIDGGLDAEYVYVDVFLDGEMVAFTSGRVGTFGPRSPDYASLMVCAVSGGQVVFAVGENSRLLFGEWGDVKFEDYSQITYEFLYHIVKDEYLFEDWQIFDERNLEKHNPTIYEGPADLVR